MRRRGAVAGGGRPLCSLSIDLDGLEHYGRLYGLDPAQCGDQVYASGLPRLLAICREVGVPATLFAIGADLATPSRAAALRDAAAAGFEIANHTLHHRYDLVRCPPAELAAEVDGGAAAIEQATGRAPVGFRAPGYTVSRPLLALLQARGYRYDSSVLPSPPYQLVKAAAMLGLRLRGRSSAAILGDWRMACSPTSPYIPAGHGLRARQTPAEPACGPLELPIGVLAGLRLPLIGQVLFLLGAAPIRALLTPRLRPGGGPIQLELHGIDGLGLHEDGLPAGLAAQPDLRLPVRDKLRILRTLLESLARRARFATLAEVAAQTLETP